MKLQRTSLFLLLAAGLMAGAVAVYETQKRNSPVSQNSDQTLNQKLFDFEESVIAALTIVRPVAPSAAPSPTPTSPATPAATPPVSDTPSPNPSSSPSSETQQPQALTVQKRADQWQLIAPLKTAADKSTVLFLTNLLTTAQRDQTLDIERERLKEFGLDRPSAMIEITLKDQKQHKLVLGKLSFDRTFLYALIDPQEKSEKVAVSLVSPQFANAVNRQLKEWQAQTSPAEDAARSTEKPEAIQSDESSPAKPTEKTQQAVPKASPSTVPETAADQSESTNSDKSVVNSKPTVKPSPKPDKSTEDKPD